MIRFIATALAGLVILCGAPSARAQVVDDIPHRQAQARAELAPQFEDGMRMSLKQTRDGLPLEGLGADEASAVLNAYDREIDTLVGIYVDRFVTILARQVPIEHLRADSPTNTPEWTAAMTEVMAMVQQDAVREGAEAAVRVVKVGCAVRAQPTQGCLVLLERIRQFEASR